MRIIAGVCGFVGLWNSESNGEEKIRSEKSPMRPRIGDFQQLSFSVWQAVGTLARHGLVPGPQILTDSWNDIAHEQITLEDFVLAKQEKDK